MFNFFKEGQMNARQEAVQNTKESQESTLLAQEKIDEAFNRFKQQA